MIVQIKTDPDFQTLKRPEYQGDAGYDLVSYKDPKIVGVKKKSSRTLYEEISYIEYDTNASVAPLDSFYALVYPRSSVSKYNLALANSVGVVDSGYRDTIKVRFKYISQPQDLVVDGGKVFTKIDLKKIYQKGDKIGQLVWTTHFHPHMEFSVNLPPSDRGLGGFGSTGV